MLDDSQPSEPRSESEALPEPAPASAPAAARDIPDEPPPGSRFKFRVRPFASIRELIASREMVMSLSEREIRSRYKQAVLGVAWAVINPIALVLVFMVFVGRFADIDTEGAPYGLYAFLGLIPWTFFASSVAAGGLSLLINGALLNKVRCPREVFPLSSIGVASFDAVISTGAFIAALVFTTTMPSATSYWVLPLLVIQFAFTTGVVLLLSSLVIYFRDLRHAIPPMLQIGIFATPVAYNLSAVSGSAKTLYCVLNPLAAVIDGYRSCVLLDRAPDWSFTGPAALSAFVFLAVGYVIFKRLEVGIADLA